MMRTASYGAARVHAPRGWVRSWRQTLLALGTMSAVAALAGCDDGNPNAIDAPAAPNRAVSAADAEARLRRTVLEAADAGAGYTLDVARVQTNEQAARARPDTAAATRQHEAWGQVLAYNVQFSAPSLRGVVFSPRLARVMNTATIFNVADGASTALTYVRALSPDLLEDVLTNEGAGTQISDTQVTKDIAFTTKGDESFAWRVSGKATFADGFSINFIADTVFVRAGAVTGSVTGVALGDVPDRAELKRLVERFIEKARVE
jgi:hypothetical protein